MESIRKEIRGHLSEYKFKNILEVGVGELTSLEDIYNFFGPDIDCYGVDLSLNRLEFGLAEFAQRHQKCPVVAKANAIQLPFADNSFDLVYTRHTLEQMPKIFQAALAEIFRVSKGHVVLFEPTYELGTITQRLKMLSSDYVRGIPDYVRSRDDVSVDAYHLMKNSANPLNHTSHMKLQINKPRDLPPSQVEFICPVTKGPLHHRTDHYFSPEAKLAFPIISGIPVLDETYAFSLTRQGIE